MNTPHVIQSPPSTHGDVLTAISDGMVALLKEFYGRGPTRAKAYYHDDLVVCVLRGGFSRVEETLLEGGRGPAVIQQRMEFQEVMRERFTGVIQDATGHRASGCSDGLTPGESTASQEIPESSSNERVQHKRPPTFTH